LRVLVIDKPNRQRAHVAIGRRVDGIDLAKIAANAGLGGSMSGRLTESMQRTPVAGAYAFSTLREEHLVLWAPVKPEQVAGAVKRMLETLGEVSKRGLAAEEIALGKIAAAAQAELSQRDAASRADAVVRAHLSAIERDQSGARFLELSDDAVKRASQSLARPDGLAIVVVASATADLQAALLAIPGVKEVQVARYDLR
jgi:predicted Zn-dependent peptidase